MLSAPRRRSCVSRRVPIYYKLVKLLRVVDSDLGLQHSFGVRDRLSGQCARTLSPRRSLRLLTAEVTFNFNCLDAI